MRRFGGIPAGHPLAVGLFAVLLLAIGLPQTFAAFASLPGDAAWWRMERSGQSSLADGELARIVSSRRAALDWQAASSTDYQLGIALTELARRGTPVPEMTDGAREAAVRHLESSAVAAPMNALTWLHLANARRVAGRPGGEIGLALAQSMLTGRYFPEIAEVRVRLALQQWTSLDAAARRLTRNQLIMMNAASAQWPARLAEDARYGPLVRALTGLPADDS